MPTPEQLAEIRKRADAATPGPWRIDQRWEDSPKDAVIISPGYWVSPGHYPKCVTDADPMIYNKDAEFIAHSRQDIPDLLDHIERLEMELAEARKQRDYEAEARARVNREMDALADKEIGE